MNRKSLLRVATVGILFSIGFTLNVRAQENRSELYIAATGFLTNSATSDDGRLSYDSSDSVGLLAGYRFNLTRWLGADLDYGYTRNSQRYFATPSFGPSTSLFSPSKFDVHQATADLVAHLPNLWNLAPYVLGGGGGLIFDPVERNPTTPGGIVGPRIPTRWEPVAVYGGGLDFNILWSAPDYPVMGLRIGYRGYLYKAPDFGFPALDIDQVVHTAVPELGLIFRF